MGVLETIKFFFGLNRNKPQLNLFQLVFRFVLRNLKKIYRFVWVFRIDIETAETNRTFLKQTQKISKKPSLLQFPQNNYFFSVWTETQFVSVVFRFVFCEANKKNFSVCFSDLDQYQNNRNKQTYGIRNLKDLYFNKFAVVLVGLLFVSVVSKHRNSLFWLFWYKSETA